jgi:exonuclease III
MDPHNIVVWNVHDLNARGRCKVVRELAAAEKPSIVCMQEMKLHVIDDFLLMEIMVPGFDYDFLPSEQTRDGILVAWRTSVWSASGISTKSCSVSVRMRHIALEVD